MKKLYRRGVELLKKTSAMGMGLDRPRRALSMAERAGGFGPAGLESLEPRQLLFTLSITPDLVDPATGVGSVTTDFGYYLPYLFRELPDPVANTNVLEDFGDEMAQWTMNVPPSPPNGTFFENSGIRIAYRSSQSAPAQLFLGPDIGQQGAMDRDLGIKLATTDQMTFSFFQGVEENMPRARLALAASVVIRPGNAQNPGFIDGNGLNTDNLTGTRIELLRAGTVVQVIRGAALDAIAQQVQQGPGDTAPVIRYNIDFGVGFDAIRFSSAALATDVPNNSGYADSFILEEIGASFPGGRFGSFHDGGLAGARVVLSGPAGTSAQFLDLYGRDMIQTTDLVVPPNGMVSPIDPNDDGVPDFNDGIGRIVITGSTQRSNLTMIGLFYENNMLQLPMDPAGNLDELEGAGFGYALTNDDPPQVIGLPPSGASLVIGSPFIRDNSTPDDYLNGGFAGIFPAGDDFLRPDQGIFVNGGNDFGAINVHAVVHGSSNFSGALRRYNSGVQLGSVTVHGDLGSMVIASDAGLWVRDDIRTFADPMFRAVNSTDAQIVVGRTVGEILVAGRSSMDITVLADINNPNRHVLNVLNYDEREVIYRFDPGTADGPRVSLQMTLDNTEDRTTTATFFGDSYYRNDTILSAEFIGASTTGVNVRGTIEGQDPVNTGGDVADVYAFAADGTRDIVIEGDRAVAYYRVVDKDGRVIAASDLGGSGRGPNGATLGSSVMRFRPAQPDVYYLVVNNQSSGAGASTPYTFYISGMVSTTFGQFRSASGSGGFGDPFVLSLSAGSMGSFRVGTGYIGGDGMEHDTLEILNTNQNNDDLLVLGSSTISVPVNLYNVTTGSDIDTANFLIGGNLGTLVTGLSPVVGQAVTEGDFTAGDVRTGGSIGALDIRGGLGIDQDSDGDRRAVRVAIRTGISGGVGHIGQLLVGAYISGPNVSIRTSAGSIIDQFIVGNNQNGDGTQFPGQVIIDGTPVFTTGSRSDIRFADFGQIQRGQNTDATLPLAYGQTLNLTDDGGATYTITIGGGVGDARLGSFATLRLLPVDGSQGVALARIDATLRSGVNLVITSTSNGVVSIGRINIDADDGLSSVLLSGPGEVDVYRIVQTMGTLAAIRNTSGNITNGGDFVAVEVLNVGEITLTTGNLGRTQTSGVGRALLGPFLGLQSGRGGGMDGASNVPLGVDPASLREAAADWDGSIFTPVNTADYTPASPLEDVGSPIDGYLDGVVSRGADLRLVQVAGSVGDVIVEGGDLLSLTANFDGITPFGRFDGIVGNIYAVAINSIDIGDGLRGTGPGPFAEAGIFADDDIVQVQANRVRGAVIEGVILAANRIAAPRTTIGNQTVVALGRQVNGVDIVTITDGRISGALIKSVAIDDWWVSLRVQDMNFYQGPVRQILGSRTDMFRSDVQGTVVNEITLTGGDFDSNLVDSSGDVGTISADNFLNSTRLGNELEFHANAISATGNLASVQTNGNTGDISDLMIDIGASLTGSISARNIIRGDFQIDVNTNRVLVVNDLRGTSINTGRLFNLQVTNDIRSSSVFVSGPLELVTAGGEITNTDFIVTGPDGRVGTITSQGRFYGSVRSSGQISLIESVNSDVEAVIFTTDETDGRLETLRAGRDLLVDLEIQSDVQTISAGRHIGRPTDARARSLDIRGNVGEILAPNGQIYSEILVGQSVTGTIRNGRVVALPGDDRVADSRIIVFGRINSMDLFGDFQGQLISHSGGIGTVTITDGSLRPDSRIAAFDGSIDSIVIIGGHLLGTVQTDLDLNSLIVRPNADGFVGHIGVANNLRSSRPIGDGRFRNQLPPGVDKSTAFDGAFITAGRDIGTILVEGGGSIWESGIYAGENIRFVQTSRIRNDSRSRGQGSFIAAGDLVQRVETSAPSSGLGVYGGIVSLGADNRPGGKHENADTVQQGAIGDLAFGGRLVNSRISSGIYHGGNGLYNTPDDKLAGGFSSIASVSVIGGVRNVSAFTDGSLGPTSGGIRRGGATLNPLDPSKISSPASGADAVTGGVIFTFFTPTGEEGKILYTGPGRAFYDDALNRITLVGSTSASAITITAVDGQLTNLAVLGTNNASLGSATVTGTLRGNSRFFIDAGIGSASFGAVNSTGFFGSYGNITSMTFASFDGGHIQARDLTALTVNGAFGSVTGTGEADATVVDLGSVRIVGVLAGDISSDRQIDSLSLGSINKAGIRAGRTIGSIVSGPATEARISSRDGITAVTINGTLDDSLIYGGVDLGRDTRFGGTGLNADVVTDGAIGGVIITGDFIESDVSAGVSRGPDGYLGTPDDKADDGRSSIASVTVQGRGFGSLTSSEQFRVISTGTVGPVTIGGQAFTAAGNLAVTRVTAAPVPVQVFDLQILEDSNVYTARITFNQPVDSSTISAALSVLEVRGPGVFIGLAEGTDYFLRYDPLTQSATVTFNRDITSRPLPQAPGVPGPGVYRFVLNAGVLRGESQGSTLDGNYDGTAGDDFSRDDSVGDPGDKITAGNPVADPSISFYGATDLNLLLDDNATADGLPDVNSEFILRGTLGDHPNQNTDTFRSGGDVDVFGLSLRAGQILRLGSMQGVAQLAGRGIYDASGTLLAANTGFAGDFPNLFGQLFPGFFGGQVGGQSGPILRLPNAPFDVGERTSDDQYLVTQTGTYYIVLAGSFATVNIADVNQINNSIPVPGSIGEYNFSIQVFDDGDSGFRGDTDSGNGITLVNAPTPIAFAGSDGQFGTPDDQDSIVTGDFTFTLNTGSDSQPNTRDDRVVGVNFDGSITAERRPGFDGRWGNPNDRIFTSVRSAIGLVGGTGVPTTINPDVDVYHLNNGQPITPGKKVRATLRLTETGSNIGLSPVNVGTDQLDLISAGQDLRGEVQFALFETPTGTTYDNGKLLFASTDFLPIGGQPQQSTSNSNVTYGYDAQGDFFIEFLVPPAQGFNGAPGRFSLYIQGAVRSDYTLEIVCQGKGTVVERSQNIFLETDGGTVDWLEVGEGEVTAILPFTSSILGFAGQFDGLDVDDYVLDRLISNLNGIFQAANLNVVISASPADFEGQDFSTVFLSGDTEPSQFFNDGTFGASEHSDPFNVDRNDEGVVFVGSLAALGNDPSRAGVDALVGALTAAVSRRIGELVGLRLTVDGGGAVVPITASNSATISNPDPDAYRFSTANRRLSFRFDANNDTNFYLGFQNDNQLLNTIIAPRF